MKERFITKDGQDIWLESSPIPAPKRGFQVRYLVTMPNDQVLTFSDFGEANAFLLSIADHVPGGFPFAFEETPAVQRLKNTLEENEAVMFGWASLEEAKEAHKAYEIWWNECALFDLAHSDWPGIEYQLMTMTGY